MALDASADERERRALRVEGILYVALAHDAKMADDGDGQCAQLMVFAVRERLRRSHHNAFARMDTQGIEVLHVAYGDAVVEAVAHHLVFYLFPPFERLLYQHLRGEREGILGLCQQLLVVVAEARAKATEGIGCTKDDGEAQSA